MESYGAVYARVPDGGVAALEAAIREARTISKHSSPLGVLAFDFTIHSFAVVDRWGRQDNMPIWSEGPDLSTALELVALSRAVGEVIAFYEIDEGTTMGIYGAWRNGVLVRDLQWADDQWVRVEGEPQPWETPLFRPKALEEALDYAPDKEQVRTIFASKQILLNASYPRPEGLSVSIRTVHPGPAFGFAPWPRRKELVEKNRAVDGPLRKK